MRLGNALIESGGRRVDFGGALHGERLVGSLLVELLDKIIEAGLLLQEVEASGARGFLLEREVHAFVPAVLLGMTGANAFDADAQAQPPHRQLGEVEQSVGRGERNSI